MKKRYFDREDTISMNEFVTRYLGTKHNCANLRHIGLKSFNNPYVVGVSNDFALSNIDYVKRRELLVVLDCNGNPGTYLNPLNLKKLVDLENIKGTLKLLEKIRLHELKKILPLYQQYQKLLSEYLILDKWCSNYYELLELSEKKYVLKKIRKEVKKIW